MATKRLRKTVGGFPIYATIAEYDSEGHKIADTYVNSADSPIVKNGTNISLDYSTTTFQTQLDGLLVEEGEPLVSEPDVTLVSQVSSNELLARRAYEDENGDNIKDTYATKAEMQAALGDIESRLAAL